MENNNVPAPQETQAPPAEPVVILPEEWDAWEKEQELREREAMRCRGTPIMIVMIFIKF
jgi:hypothetical protein